MNGRRVTSGWREVTPMGARAMCRFDQGSVRSVQHEVGRAGKGQTEIVMCFQRLVLPPNLVRPSRAGARGRACGGACARTRVRACAFTHIRLDVVRRLDSRLIQQDFLTSDLSPIRPTWGKKA